MTGLVKPKTYDWKDSNLALFGSDTEKQVKKESAESEPAWQGAGQRAGLQIWRIVQFQVCDWSKDLYGKFYNGDSYIILNTYKPDPSSEELAYDLHFWIGSNSTQDEYGTAAYKTVELDTFLDDKAVQHRECEGHESDLFLSYFPKGLSLLEGGADTGFHHVEPEKYTPRLMHFSGKGRKVVVKQVPAAKSRLQSGDVFILDMGIKLFQWNGSDASPFEKNKAMEYVSNIKTERSGRRVDTEVLDEDMSGMSDSHPFYAALTEPDQTDDYQVDDEETDKTPHLYRVSDAGGSVEFSDVKVGAIRKSDLDSGDVFLVDTSKFCFVWVGRGASPTEKKSGLGYAHAHLQKTSNPLRSIVVVKEGQESKDFKMALAA